MSINVKNFFIALLNFFFKLIPVKNNQILFQCGRGMLDESPKAIYDYIKQQKTQKYKLIWIIDKDTVNSEIPKNEYCYSKTLKSFFVLASSKYWIRSQSIGSHLKKKNTQIYIQTWHGHGTLKKMGNDKTGKKEQLSHTKEWDYLICESDPCKKIMLSSTGYTGKTCVIGYPSTDIIINKHDDKKYLNTIRKKLNIDNNKKIILYAPTYRDWFLNEKKVTLPISKLKKLTSEYNILIRIHPLVRKKLEKDFLEKNHFIDCNDYPNMEDLLLVSDLLITDYSGTFSEYALLKKPTIFYAFDYERYSSENGFYLNYEKDLPGIIVHTEEELYNAIKEKSYDKKIYKEKLQSYNKKFNNLNDGKVAERFYKMLVNGEFEKDV